MDHELLDSYAPLLNNTSVCTSRDIGNSNGTSSTAAEQMMERVGEKCEEIAILKRGAKNFWKRNYLPHEAV